MKKTREKLYATGISWDTDNEKIALPAEVELPKKLIECRCKDWWTCEHNTENVNNYLSNEYGWLVNSYSLVLKKKKKTEYEKIMDNLNLIDEQAEQCSGDLDEAKARAKAYDLVADFIDKHANKKNK